MNDFELGFNYLTDDISISANAYYMLFNNEIVKQGQVDRFGQPVTGNMDNTIHRGIELTAIYKPIDGLEILVNSTFSSNYINSGKTYIKYRDPLTQNKITKEIELKDNNISGFSNLMFSGIVKYKTGGLTLQLESKYIGEFYSDNYGSNLGAYRLNYPGITSYADNKVDGYLTANLFASYDFQQSLFFNNIKMFIQINNVFDNYYAAYAIGGEFFPAAERNILFGLKLGL